MRFELLQTGETGHGKTRRTLDATRFGPLLIMDFDGKAEAAMRTLTDQQKALITVVNLKDSDYNQALEALKQVAVNKSFEYATIAIDTFTMLNEKVYIECMGGMLEKGKKADFDIWGAVDNKLLNYFNILFKCPANIIINAHVALDEGQSGKLRWGPAGRGGFRARIAPRVSDSHYLVLRDGKYKIRARNSETLPANSNFPEEFYDKNGDLLVNDLSVFDNYAIKKQAK